MGGGHTVKSQCTPLRALIHLPDVCEKKVVLQRQCQDLTKCFLWYILWRLYHGFLDFLKMSKVHIVN